MGAARISSDLVNRIARGLEGTTATAVIKDTKRGIEIVLGDRGATVLPSPDEGVDAWDKAVGIER